MPDLSDLILDVERALNNCAKNRHLAPDNIDPAIGHLRFAIAELAHDYEASDRAELVEECGRRMRA